VVQTLIQNEIDAISGGDKNNVYNLTMDDIREIIASQQEKGSFFIALTGIGGCITASYLFRTITTNAMGRECIILLILMPLKLKY
jgi:hypothetical protein